MRNNRRKHKRHQSKRGVRKIPDFKKPTTIGEGFHLSIGGVDCDHLTQEQKRTAIYHRLHA